MAAVHELPLAESPDEYALARQRAAERVNARGERSIFDELTGEQWRRITSGERPEVSGRWPTLARAR